MWVISTPFASVLNVTLARLQPTKAPCTARKMDSSLSVSRFKRFQQGELRYRLVCASILPLDSVAAHSSRRTSLSPSASEGMAPSTFDSAEVGTELALTSNLPLPMLEMLTISGLQLLRGPGLDLVGPSVVGGASATGVMGIDRTALPTGTATGVKDNTYPAALPVGAASGVDAGSTTRENMGSPS